MRSGLPKTAGSIARRDAEAFGNWPSSPGNSTDVIQFTRPPRVVQRILFGSLAPLARLLGYRGSYPEYSTRGPSGVVAVEPLNGVAVSRSSGPSESSGSPLAAPSGRSIIAK